MKYSQNKNSKTIEICKYRMHYIESGIGRPIICLPGLTADSFMFRKIVSCLEKSHKLYLIDFLGSGLSDKPLRDYSLTFYIEQLEQFITKKRLNDVILLASSWGVIPGVKLALKHRRKVRELILISPVSPKLVHLIIDNVSFQEILQLTQEGKKSIGQLEEYYRRRLRSIFGVELSERIFSRYFKIITSFEGRFALLSTYAHSKVTISPEDFPITQKTLLIWGDNDPIVPKAGMDWWQSVIPSHELYIIPGAAHVLTETHPKKVCRILTNFLSRSGCNTDN